MNKILIICILLFASQVFTQTSTVDLKETGTSVADLTPKGWKLLASTSGDLNKDGFDDLVFIIQNTNPEHIEKHTGMGNQTIDLNPRVMGIYFQDASSKTYKKQKQLDRFIALRDSPTMDEPLDGLSISGKGVLKISFRFWYSAGSWTFAIHDYAFRYDQKYFNFIGYDLNDIHRGSGDQTNYSINFLTRKMRVTTGSIGRDKPDKIDWKTFKLNKLKNFESFQELFKWEFMGLYI